MSPFFLLSNYKVQEWKIQGREDRIGEASGRKALLRKDHAPRFAVLIGA